MKHIVGVTLLAVDLVSPTLLKIAKELEKTDGLVLALNKSLKTINVDSSGLRGLTTATNATNRAFEKANVSAAAFEARLGSINRASAGSAMFGRGGGGRGPGGTHGGNIHVGPGGVGLGTMGFAAGAGYMPLLAAGAAAYGGYALYESAKSLDTERYKFRLFGMSEAQNQEAFGYAKNMHIYGSTQIENLRNFREAQGIFRESGLSDSSALRGAKMAAPILSKLNALDSALDGEGAERSAASNLAMLRWIESAGGLKSQGEFDRLANIGYRLKVGSGDTVDWQRLQQFQVRGGSSAINLSAGGIARLEPAMSTMGGGAVGVGLATGFNRLQGIVKNLPVPVIDELLQYGVWDKSKVALNRRGGVAKFLDPNGPMSAANSKLLSEDPEGFYEKIIRPIYTKMNLDAAGVIRQNSLIYGRTMGAVANEWEKSLATISRAAAAVNKTKDIAGATAQLPDSLAGQEKEFMAAWTDFKTDFGTRVLPYFSTILKIGSSIARTLPDTIDTAKPIVDFAMNPLRSILNNAFNQSAPTQKSYVQPNRYGSGSPGPGHVYLDKHKVGIVISQEQAKAMGGPQTGTSYFDASQTPMPAGGGF